MSQFEGLERRAREAERSREIILDLVDKVVDRMIILEKHSQVTAQVISDQAGRIVDLEETLISWIDRGTLDLDTLEDRIGELESPL